MEELEPASQPTVPFELEEVKAVAAEVQNSLAAFSPAELQRPNRLMGMAASSWNAANSILRSVMSSTLYQSTDHSTAPVAASNS